MADPNEMTQSMSERCASLPSNDMCTVLLAQALTEMCIHLSGDGMRTVLLPTHFGPITSDYQYFVYPPLALITAATLLGMLSTKSLQTNCGMASHSFSTLSHSSNIPPGGVGCPPSLLLRCHQSCLTRLRPGDCAGHGTSLIWWFLDHSLAFCRYAWGQCPAQRWGQIGFCQND